MTQISSSRSGWLTAGLCFLVALLEGFDLQSAGMAAAGISAEFRLTPAQLGWLFSAGLLGLLPGALFGGMLADRFGRKRVLLCAVLLFGLASVGTACAWDLASLLLSRFLTSAGIGAALPLVIALASESAAPEHRSLAVSVTFCGMPLGGACAAALGMTGGLSDWRLVFYVGGFAPIGVAFMLAFWLPESRMFRQQVLQQQLDGNAPVANFSELFAGGLWRSTLLLWLSSFFTLTVLYMLMNWLPSLLLGHGFGRQVVGQVQILFNLCGACAAVLTGRLLDRGHVARTVCLGYGAILAGLAGLGLGTNTLAILAAGAVVGYGLMCGQAILYAVAPTLYCTRVRGTGVGLSVAVGRLGSIGGPLVAGTLLSAGVGIGGIVMAVVPGIIIAAGGAYALLGRRAASGSSQ
ncbi:3-(3-hydroxy-phenyl)propionate transporter MhpT [Herbaspirillum sp. LeCh32-8]|uniref:3-(3-hydroxy-phenyl)propionate transporter MhpT n=1 Tax=Herbaspirillum sp. LeCh32-8 TaxID=2821356 RepID=UPI001FD72A37|nr:3-(3-hydroxy-phenyl)propionate transporter MhpT [Herbaspirillum sp. LeCh32-8]